MPGVATSHSQRRGWPLSGVGSRCPASRQATPSEGGGRCRASEAGARRRDKPLPAKGVAAVGRRKQLAGVATSHSQRRGCSLSGCPASRQATSSEGGGRCRALEAGCERFFSHLGNRVVVLGARQHHAAHRQGAGPVDVSIAVESSSGGVFTFVMRRPVPPLGFCVVQQCDRFSTSTRSSMCPLGLDDEFLRFRKWRRPSRYKRPLRSQRFDRGCHSFSAQGSLWTYWRDATANSHVGDAAEDCGNSTHPIRGQAPHSHVPLVQRVQKTVEVTQSHSAPTLVVASMWCLIVLSRQVDLGLVSC